MSTAATALAIATTINDVTAGLVAINQLSMMFANSPESVTVDDVQRVRDGLKMARADLDAAIARAEAREASAG